MAFGEDIMAHGCNSRGVMGAGVAKLIRDRYPRVFNEYKRFCGSIYCRPGRNVYTHENFSEFPVGHWGRPMRKDGYIISCITQGSYGRSEKQYVNYDALKECIQGIDEFCIEKDINRVAMPKIGAGLGGGDWNKISKIIEEYSSSFVPVIYYLK